MGNGEIDAQTQNAPSALFLLTWLLDKYIDKYIHKYTHKQIHTWVKKQVLKVQKHRKILKVKTYDRYNKPGQNTGDLQQV